MKRIDADRVQVIRRRYEVIRPSGRRRAGLQSGIARNDGEIAGADVEGHDLHSGTAGVHLRLIESPYTRALK